MDFYDILDFCAFDVQRASEMASEYRCTQEIVKEALDEIGLEKMEPEPYVTRCGRLCYSRDCPCSKG